MYINMLKSDVPRDEFQSSAASLAPVPILSASYCPDTDDLTIQNASADDTKLQNSEITLFIPV